MTVQNSSCSTKVVSSISSSFLKNFRQILLSFEIEFLRTLWVKSHSCLKIRRIFGKKGSRYLQEHKKNPFSRFLGAWLTHFSLRFSGFFLWINTKILVDKRCRHVLMDLFKLHNVEYIFFLRKKSMFLVSFIRLLDCDALIKNIRDFFVDKYTSWDWSWG